MKKQIFVFGALLTLLVYSCTKDTTSLKEVVQPEATEAVKMAQPADFIDLEVGVENGRLAFSTYDEFRSAMDYLADNEERFFTRDAHEDWNYRLGFESSLVEFEKILDEADKIESMQAYEAFTREYANDVVFGYDGAMDPKVRYSLAPLTESQFSSVRIGNDIHIFKQNEQIILPLSLESSLADIYQNPTDYVEQGVIINLMVRPDDTAAERVTCANSRWLKCEDTNGSSRGARRIIGEYELVMIINNSSSLTAELDLLYEVTIKSHVRGCCWWKRNHDEVIEFGTGWGAKYKKASFSSTCVLTLEDKDFCHGTGWAQRTWRITYTKRIEKYSFNGQCPNPTADLSPRYIYNTNFARNNNVSGVSCENSCWDRACN